jgi:hypothetical protein
MSVGSSIVSLRTGVRTLSPVSIITVEVEDSYERYFGT